MQVKVPTLIIHGKSDQDIPPDHARRLFEACSSAKKFLVCPSRLDHNTNVLADPAFFFNPMVKFFSLPGGRPLGPQTELRPLPLRFFSPSESPPIERSPRAVCRVGGETLSNLLAAEIETETRTVPHSLTEEEAASVGVQSDDAEVEEPSLESPPSPEGVALPLPGQGGATAGSKEKKGFWGVLVDFVQRGVRFVLGLGF
uniref:Peptidase S9 prolyl oligopeptidase catalytic domain-containing protein n=1 Tax=Chromera velia CCMP2878 TaxID=1169474 RepID=A0A0G4F2P5_9ALVE|eukprot:Cvel_14840.t1-p1 / transcript=Cvel_14840.t1 / gene=Cvel_14840 / organism=Chromera_velia_CCMP2878 / gene_product=hypothetical protein / transcript_product=hypothetical protein / location=Cvel_scaffold1072:4259-5373(+) / protein_length=199 / sequence_SO=supercontig / SO=protein_coding / is_pseudo=false